MINAEGEVEMSVLLSPPTNCNVCNSPIADKVYDKNLFYYRWTYICPDCFSNTDGKLGVGYGQEYTKQEDGRFMKTEG